MIMLRAFLYSIFFLSIGWSILVFAGPSIIKTLIVEYTDGFLTPSNISVSPTLGINIGRLDFQIQTDDEKKPITGFSRSTEISWSLFKQKPFLNISIGPTTFKEIATAKNISIYTLSYENVDFQNPFIFSKTKDLKLTSLGEFDELILSSNLSLETSKMSNLNVEAQIFTSQNNNFNWLVDTMKVSLSDLDLKIPFGDQFLSGIFSATDIVIGEQKLIASKADGEINAIGDVKNLKINLEKVGFPNFGGSVNKIEFYGKYDGANSLKNLTADFLNGTFTNGLPSFSRISTDILKKDDTNYVASIKGKLDQFELTNSGSFIGTLPSSDLSMSLELNSITSRIESKSKISSEVRGVDELNSQVEMRLKLEPLTNLTNCINESCQISEFEFMYQINLDGEWVKGRSFCAASSCSFSALDHSLETSNTAKVFQDFTTTGILSPLYSAYLYSAITSGQKINRGHQLKF